MSKAVSFSLFYLFFLFFSFSIVSTINAGHCQPLFWFCSADGDVYKTRYEDDPNDPNHCVSITELVDDCGETENSTSCECNGLNCDIVDRWVIRGCDWESATCFETEGESLVQDCAEP